MIFSNFTSKKQKIAIAIIVFFIAWIWQSININAEGRTWDEEYKVDMGYEAITNLQHGDFSFASWNDGTEHPMVAKYVYTLAALPEILTLNRNAPVPLDTQMYLETAKYYAYTHGDLVTVVNYDYTFPRLLSAAFNATTVALVFLIASCFLSPLTSFFVVLVLLTTPWFVAMGRLITYESLSDALYTTTGIVFAYLLAKKQPKWMWYIFVGFLSGLLLWTRYNNAYIFLFLFGWWVMWHFLHTKDKKKFLSNKSLYNWKLIFIPVVAVFVGFATWPYLWMNFPKDFINTFSQNGSRVSPLSLYYYMYFFYTTPVPYLILFVTGIVLAIKKHTYYALILLWSLLSMIIFYTILSAPTGGTRYTFSVYIPYALLCGLGLETIAHWISQKIKKSLEFVVVILGGISVLFVLYFAVIMIHPYYLDYYNEFAGGLPGAANKQLSVSWWGEGQKEAGSWLDAHAAQKASVALRVTPMYVFPPLRNDLVVYPYNTHIGQTDYLVVDKNDMNYVKDVLPRYKKVYSVTRQGVDLEDVFQRK